MSGADGQRGLVYQQRYLIFRALAELGLGGGSAASGGLSIAEFSIEGRTSHEGPIWDVRIAFTNQKVDLCECKDTEISKNDRLAFYDRIRAEVGFGTAAEDIQAVWVTDPDKQTSNSLKYIDSIQDRVVEADLAKLGKTPPVRMKSAADALNEAIYRLCHHAGSGNERTPLQRPCTLGEARSILSRLRVDRCRNSELEQSVKLLAAAVLAKGTPDAVSRFITGTLTETIANHGEAKFTRETFLEAIGLTMIGFEVEDRVRRILTFRAASGFVSKPRWIEWRALDGRQTTRWSLAERSFGYDPRHSSLVIASMGVGKTVASHMAFDEQATKRSASQVLRLEARDLSKEDLKATVRAACLLTGVAPTWLAIDGLDEVSQDNRLDWMQTITQLSSLPNLTLFVTVRREVYAIHEWLQRATAGLAAVEMHPLASGQVIDAFTEVGLPAPTNARLIEVLRNPFLLSLYAAVVTCDDMPLSQSGDATAFLVVDQFWQRQVRGVSLGQRAIGESERSQDSKRLAAVYLSDRTLTGDLTIGIDSVTPEVAGGIEMLRREGVIRDHGTSAVVWVHEWIREYAIIDRLLGRLSTFSAVALARQVAKDCVIDYVARSAAAAGVKWVVAHQESGNSTDFVSELWTTNQALAREALAVLLEGSASAFSLADLSDQLLVEALTLAINLGAPQWGEQVASLSEAKFQGDDAAELHVLAAEYEVTTASTGSRPAIEPVERLATRDFLRIKSKWRQLPRVQQLLLEKAIPTGAYLAQPVQEWLVALGEVIESWALGDLLKIVGKLVDAEQHEIANQIYRAAAGLENPARQQVVFTSIVERRMGSELADFLTTPKLLTENIDLWGATAVEFLADLIEANQRHDWPSSRRLVRVWSKATGESLPDHDDEEFSLNFDADPRWTTLNPHDQDGATTRIATALLDGLRVLAAHDTADDFRRLADFAVETKHAAIAVLPMVILYDASRGVLPVRRWHVTEIARLLTIRSLVELASISGMRRLAGRRVALSSDETAKGLLLAAIRGADIENHVRTWELSDFRDTDLLTSSEESEVQRAGLANEIPAAVDPRGGPTFPVSRGAVPESPSPGAGWPHPEDDELIRRVAAHITDAERSAENSEALLESRLDAIRVLVAREAALQDEWLGRVLDWCHASLKWLRRTVTDKRNKEEPLSASTWRGTLDRRAEWWPQLAKIALNRLQLPVPKRHAKELNGELPFHSGDPIRCALDLLDVLLSIKPAPPFDAFQDDLVKTIVSQWNDWPSYTRAAVLASNGPWFWYHFPQMRSLLQTTLTSESNAEVLRYAVGQLVSIASVSPAPELFRVIERAASAGHFDAVKQIAQLYGQSTVRTSLPAPTESIQILDQGFRDALTLNWTEAESLADFLRWTLQGATDFAYGHDWSQPLEDAWLKCVGEIMDRWPFRQLTGDDAGRFPVHALFSNLQRKLPLETRTRLFLRLVPTLQTILETGDLADYCDLHRQLKGIIVGRGPSAGASVAVSDAVETALVTLCHASVDRVASWKAEGRTPGDSSWVGGLEGKMSVDLIKISLNASRERDRTKRELASLIDRLADLELRWIAADLRAYMRRL